MNGKLRRERAFFCRSRFYRRKKKFNIVRFNAREAAYAFLRQYDGETFIKAQKVKNEICLFS